MKDKLELYLQTELHFSSIDSKKITYCLEGILSEMSKLLIIFTIAITFGYAYEVLISTFILLSIRCNCGGLHFSHYFSCFTFTSVFYLATIILSQLPLPNPILACGLHITLEIFSLIGPITSPMRPRLTQSDVQKYSSRTTFILLIYSLILILSESLPYRNLIYWVIVLQIFQLLCAKIAQKGESYEKIYYTKDL